MQEIQVMQATTCAVAILLALVIDWMSIGPTGFRDRLAFLIALPALRSGFDGSELDRWTVGTGTATIQWLLDQAPSGARIAGAAANVLFGALIAVVWLYCLGCLLPVKLAKQTGRLANLTFPASNIWRVNWPLWACALALGMCCDLPTGAIGRICRWSVDALVAPVAAFVSYLFGVPA